MSIGTELQRLSDAGFSQEELGAYTLRQSQRLTEAGFPQADIDKYFGHPQFDPSPIHALVKINLEQGKSVAASTDSPREAMTMMDAIEAGLQMSVTGLVARGKAPDIVLPEGAGRSQRVASMIGALAGDVPAMVGGALVGGTATGPLAPVGAMAGAFALPAGVRRILMDKYEKGEVATFADFWDRLSGAVIETSKGYVVGAATGAVGKGIAALPIVSPTVKAAATLTGEVVTMVAVGSALDQHMPNADDFIDAALALGFVKGSMRIASKLRKIYAETGVKPSQVLEDASKDPTILPDLMSHNIAIPKRYSDELADALARERAPAGKGVERRATGEFVDVKPQPTLPELAGKAVVPQVPDTSKTGAFFDPNQQGPVARVVPPFQERPAPMPTAIDIVSGKAALDRAKEDETRVLEKSRALRSAEEILQERNILKSAEEMISQEPRPKLREKVYILPKGRGPAISDQDMAEINAELRKAGIVFGEEGEPVWKENVPVSESQQAVLDRIVQDEPSTKKLTLAGLYTSVIDNLHPIKRAVDEAGKPLETAKDPYQLERLTRGLMLKGTHFIKYGAFRFDDYETISKGYEEILKPVKDDLDGFRAYMVSKRAIEKEGQGITTGIPLEEAKAIVKAGKDKYETVHRERIAYREALIDYMKDAGILTPERVVAMREANKEYVPFYRFFEEQEGGRPSSTKGVRDPVKQMKGGEQKILDPIVSDIKDTFLFLGLAEKNAARQAYVALGPEFAEPIRTKSDPVTKKELQAIVEEHGVSEEAAQAIATIRPQTFRAQKNELVVFENGERKVYKVNPDVAEAFEDANKVGSSFLAQMIHAPSVLLRAGVTIAPDFIMRNILRDAVSAFVYAGSNPIKTAKGLKSILMKDTAFTNWMKGGGGNATMVALDRDYISKHLLKLNADTGLMERAINVAKTPLDLLQVLSELVENSTRIGSVRDPLKHAKDKATIQALSMIAREATVDFARHGKDVQEYAKSTAFFNPALQGIDRFNRAMANQPLATTAKALGSVTLPSLLLWWANKDDDEIANLPKWQKDLFWIARIPTGGGDSFLLRIPKAQEIGILFGTVPERLLDAFVAEKPDAMKDIERTLIDAFSPAMIPTAAVPVISQFANRNTFTGGALIPQYLEGLMPEYQYTEYTTETAKAIGQLIGAFPGMEKAAISEQEPLIGGVARALTTPALIENYVRAWSGGMGMYIFQLADMALRKSGALPDPNLPASTLADIPVIKAFVVRYPSAQAQSIQDFYDTFAEKKRVFDTFQAKAKEGDFAASQRVLQFDQSALVQLDDVRASLTMMSQTIRMISKNPEMTPSDKRQLIDTLYYRMIEISQYGNSALRTIESTVNK